MRQISTNKFHIDDFFLPPIAPDCSRVARISSAHRTLSCSSNSRSLYWLRSSSTRAISTLVNFFLWATVLSSYIHTDTATHTGLSAIYFPGKFVLTSCPFNSSSPFVHSLGKRQNISYYFWQLTTKYFSNIPSQHCHHQQHHHHHHHYQHHQQLTLLLVHIMLLW